MWLATRQALGLLRCKVDKPPLTLVVAICSMRGILNLGQLLLDFQGPSPYVPVVLYCMGPTSVACPDSANA